MPLPNDPDTFGFLVTDVARLLRAEMDRRIAEAGLDVTPGESRTLFHVARGGVIRQAALAERMGIEAMTASAYLDRLEARGLIERRPDPSDGRAKLVQLTPDADAVLEKTRAIGQAVRDEVSQAIAPEDWRRLNTGLKLAREKLSAMRADASNREGPKA